jgi:NitT/TauT family transport system permease protein
VIVSAALPEILAGSRIGCIRGVKDVLIGQLLVSIIGYSALFEFYSPEFLDRGVLGPDRPALRFAIFISEGVAALKRRVKYCVGVRS